MKKSLSLVLALCLLCGLTMTAGAAAPDRFDGNWRTPVSVNSWEAIRLTNVERVKEGLTPLSTFEGLHAAAQLRAEELKTTFSHARPDGQSCMTALYDVGLDPYDFGRSGENIAAGYGSPAAVVSGWMNSPGHRTNILTAPFTHIGLGSEDRRWTQMFLGICSPQITGVTIGKDSYPMGTALEDMEGVVALHCEHGDSYLPLSSEMCSGYNNTRVGSQSVTVRYMDQSISFNVALTYRFPFVDVPSKAFYYEPVQWAVSNGITTGISSTIFSPGQSCNRGQIVTFLWRAHGSPTPQSTENPFVDVSKSDFFYNAVLWAKERGITAGTDDTHFSPGLACSRAQAVTFIWRADGEPTGTGKTFADVSAGSYYEEAVKWAVGRDITSGTGSTTFSPMNICSRGEIVTFLYRDMRKKNNQ